MTGCIKHFLCYCTDPGFVLTTSGTPAFVGVVTVEVKGDLGVPGVFGVVGFGDMGVGPTSWLPSINPGGLVVPSLQLDF